MPWKNGLGVTTEIARSPRDGDFDWRVSIAQVASDGPFSLFPGCTRIILALDGAGMILTSGAHSEVALGALEPWTFSGDAQTNCALRDGPFRDFNVIARRASFVPALSIIRPAARQTIDAHAETAILYCATGAALVEAGGTFTLSRDEALLIEQPDGKRKRFAISPSEQQTVIIHAMLSATR